MGANKANGLNVAVAGCGYWGPNLIRNFYSLSECTMKTVIDTDQKRLDHMKSLYPKVETSCDFDEVISKNGIDAVVISTPVRFHYDMAKKSLEAGKHTFIEKPMATSTDQCKDLIRIAKEKKLTLMLGHTFIYSQPVRRIKEIYEWGDLGEIQNVSARRLNLGLFQTDINVAWDLAPHDISIILYVLNEAPLSVNCQGKAHIHKEIEDITNMTLNFKNGGFATIQSSWIDPNKVRDMTFVGTRRMLLYNDMEPVEKIKIYDKRVETPPHYDTFAEFHYAYHYGDMYSPFIKQSEPLKMEAQHFIDCIKTGCKPESCAMEGLRVVQILEAAQKSLKSGGGKVDIEPLAEVEHLKAA